MHDQCLGEVTKHQEVTVASAEQSSVMKVSQAMRAEAPRCWASAVAGSTGIPAVLHQNPVNCRVFREKNSGDNDSPATIPSV